MISEKKSLNDNSLVNEHCNFTKKFKSKYALLKLDVLTPFSFANERK